MNHLPAFSFPAFPSFHQLWGVCIEDRITPQIASLESVFAHHNIARSSSILDTCSGSGSFDIALMKRGFDLATTDGDAEMLKLFRKNLAENGIDHEPTLAKWSELPGVFGDRKFDAVICCGNSFIYSGGFWNNDGEIDRERALGNILKTLKTFRGLLAPGGIFLVDKPADDEQNTRELIAHVCVADGEMYDVFFSITFDAARQRRNAQILLRHQVTGEEIGVPNVAYHLKDAELQQLLVEAGFSRIDHLPLAPGQHFPTWIVKT